MNPSPTKSPPSNMMAPVEHIKLSKIVSCVLRDLYPIRPPSMALRIELAAKYSKDLHEWRAPLSRFLDPEGVDSSLLIPLYQRQRNVLNLAYYHAVLLVHRPFLLSNFASLAHTDTRAGNLANTTTDKYIRELVEAAMGIAQIVDEMFQSSQIFRAFWFTQYYAFCAVVVLYIYRIQEHIVAPGKCEGFFSAGQRCQAQLNCLSDTDCLSKRYCLVLEELRLEAARQTKSTHLPAATSTAVSSMTTLTSSANPTSISTATDTTLSSLGGLDNNNLSLPTSSNAPTTNLNSDFSSSLYSGTSIPTPESAVFSNNFLSSSSLMADLTSWGQFDSLVTAGIGGLGALDGGFQSDGGLSGFGIGVGR
jgi:hypothetical protein